MDRAAIHHFLKNQRYVVVSSSSEAGVPQSALVGIAISPGWDIIFDTVKTSRKYPNLVARPHCSFVVGWTGEQTVQLEGHAVEVKGVDLERFHQVYFAAWPE